MTETPVVQDAPGQTPAPAPAAPPVRRATRNAGPGPLAADLRVAIMRTSRRLRAEAASREISPAQYSVLAAIVKGSLTVGQLAEREMVQAPSMTRIVNGLDAAGFVTREENPGDRRQVLVQITDDGVTALSRARSKRTQWLAKRVAALTPDERATLAEAARILGEMSGV
ncbi:MarR family winged helix-turn-helix transcriptional regulator [Specibacter sp. RAF43]|uniref:MarR family winged helix-turn-helix transcriptional regulator n=1 Tax=Specibacter sp. RAF43 TaxID=3233057 RepID=UPI003F94CF50